MNQQNMLKWMKSDESFRPVFEEWETDRRTLAKEIGIKNFYKLNDKGYLLETSDADFEDDERYQLKQYYEPEEKGYDYFDVEVESNLFCVELPHITAGLHECLSYVNFAGVQFENSDNWEFNIRCFIDDNGSLFSFSNGSNAGVKVAVPKRVRFLK